MIIVHKLTLDLVCRDAMPRIDAVQGDCNTRMVELALQSGGEAWEIPAGTRVRLRYCKCDGTKGLYDTLPDGTVAWTTEGNRMTVILAPQMLTVAGPVLAQAELTNGKAVAATFAFQVNVEPDPAAGVLTSEDYVSMVQWMDGQLEKLLEKAKESGLFDGAPGPQGQPGEPGPSAYEFAVNAGYTGTEAEFGQMLITQYLALSGGTMGGNIAMNGYRVTGLAAPQNLADAATKNYVDQKRSTYSVTLYPSDWSGDGPYTVTVRVAGLRDFDRPHIGPIYSGDVAADLAMMEEGKKLSYARTEPGNLIFTCLREKPAGDISVQIEVLR